MQMMLSFRSDN